MPRRLLAIFACWLSAGSLARADDQHSERIKAYGTVAGMAFFAVEHCPGTAANQPMLARMRSSVDISSAEEPRLADRFGQMKVTLVDEI